MLSSKPAKNNRQICALIVVCACVVLYMIFNYVSSPSPIDTTAGQPLDGSQTTKPVNKILKLQSDSKNAKTYKIGIIGAGIAGVGAALTIEQKGYQIQRPDYYGGKYSDYKVVWHMFEKEEFIGGHAFAYNIAPGMNGIYDIKQEQTENDLYYDMGFIFGHGPYSGLVDLYDEWDVDVANTTLEFSAVDKTRANYENYYFMTDNSDNNDMNNNNDEYNHRYGRFNRGLKHEIDKWHRLCLQNYNNSFYNFIPLGAVLWYHGFSDEFIDYCIYPALSLLFISKNGFFHQSARFIFGMYEGDLPWISCKVRRPCWTVRRSSHDFFSKFYNKYRDNIATDYPIFRIDYDSNNRGYYDRGNGERIMLNNNPTLVYNAIVVTLTTESIVQIYKTNIFEKFLFSLYYWEKHYTVLHNDTSILPANKEYHRNFNFVKTRNDPSHYHGYHLTGIMSNVQNRGSNDNPRGLIALNTNTPYDYKDELDKIIDEKKIFTKKTWTHVTMTVSLMVYIYLGLHDIVETKHIRFAGSWIASVAHSRSYHSGKKAVIDIIRDHDDYLILQNRFYLACYIFVLMVSLLTTTVILRCLGPKWRENPYWQKYCQKYINQSKNYCSTHCKSIYNYRLLNQLTNNNKNSMGNGHNNSNNNNNNPNKELFLLYNVLLSAIVFLLLANIRY